MLRFGFVITGLVAAVCLASCAKRTSPARTASPGNVPTMTNYDYLACDGGPHLVIPEALSSRWKGVALGDPLDPSSDYGRSCAAAMNQRMALLTVGDGQAIVLRDPPLSAWGQSPEKWVDIYCLEHWSSEDADALIGRALAAAPTSVMRDTGKAMKLEEPGLILLYAGDVPGEAVYDEHHIPIDAGSYRILEGHYRVAGKEEVYIYRLRPTKD